MICNFSIEPNKNTLLAAKFRIIFDCLYSINEGFKTYLFWFISIYRPSQDMFSNLIFSSEKLIIFL